MVSRGFLLWFVLFGGACSGAQPTQDPRPSDSETDQGQIGKALKQILDPDAATPERELAVKGLARTNAGALALLALADQGKLPEEFRATASFALAASPDAEARAQGDKKLPVPKSKDGKPLPPISKLLEMKGNAGNGGKVYRDPKGPNCIGCHPIGDEGKMVGPPLATIGTKLSKEQMYESILTPSAAILMGYENWIVRTTSGDVKTGIKVEDTDDHITLKDNQGEFIDIPLKKIAEKKQSRISMMPEDITKAMSVQELIDLVEFLLQQK